MLLSWGEVRTAIDGSLPYNFGVLPYNLNVWTPSNF